MGEARVIVIPRKPNGRKRSGGGYLGRWKDPRRRLSSGARQLAELMVGPEWRTSEELAALIGSTAKRASPRLTEIRRFGASEFVLLSRPQAAFPDRLEKPWRPRLEYRVERVETHASD